MNTKLVTSALATVTLLSTGSFALATPALATPALATPARDDEAQRLLRMKIDGPFANTTTQSKSTTRINRDGQSLLIEQRGEQITMVSLNNEPIPEDRVRISDGTIEILSPDKKTVLMKEQIQGLGSFRPMVATVTTRRVMLGVTLEEIDENLREHLGLKEDVDYALVEDVNDDSPASKAGLKPRDIIIAADGVSDISADDLRAKIRGKKAGEKLNLTVLRRGQKIELTATLEEVTSPFDDGGSGSWPNTWQGNQGWGSRNFDDREMKALTDELARKSEQAGKDAAEQARKLIDDLKRQGVIRGDDNTVVVPRPGQPMVFSTIESQTKELEAKLKDMNDRLRRMEELLARLEGRTGAPVPPAQPSSPAQPDASSKKTP